MTKEGRFTHESLQDAETIATYLQSLIRGFEKGRIALKSHEGELTLHPRDMINFDVRAKKKNDKSKLTLRISWKSLEKNDTSFSIDTN